MKVVIDIPEEYYEIIKHDVENGMDYRPCVLIAEGTPLEDVKTIRGKWICVSGSCAVCNKCNRLNEMYGNFCKHCGADMRKESEEEE